VFHSHSVKPILFAGQVTERHNAHEKIQNQSTNASDWASILENNRTHNAWKAKKTKKKNDVKSGMHVCKPLQREQEFEIERRPRQRKPCLAASSSATDSDAGNNKHAALGHLSLLELQPALSQSIEHAASRCSHMLQLRTRARV
jgi:hypothetical protein